MVKPYDMDDSPETIQGLSDEDLNAQLTDDRYINSGNKQFAIIENNRRHLNKITKNSSKIGADTWLAIIGFGFIVAAFLLAVFMSFFQ